MLDANPLLPIANTMRIHAVVRGRVIDSAGVRTMLEDVRAQVAKGAAPPKR